MGELSDVLKKAGWSIVSATKRKGIPVVKVDMGCDAEMELRGKVGQSIEFVLDAVCKKAREETSHG